MHCWGVSGEFLAFLKLITVRQVSYQKLLCSLSTFCPCDRAQLHILWNCRKARKLLLAPHNDLWNILICLLFLEKGWLYQEDKRHSGWEVQWWYSRYLPRPGEYWSPDPTLSQGKMVWSVSAPCTTRCFHVRSSHVRTQNSHLVNQVEFLGLAHTFTTV